MPPLHTILLLCALASPVFSATLFVISGSVTCNLSKPWQYSMRVVEDDIMTKDILFTDKVRAPPLEVFFYNISAVDTTDIISKNYEIEVEVLHNCNDRVFTKNARSLFVVGKYAVNHGTHYITFNMNLTNHGVKHRFQLTDWSE